MYKRLFSFLLSLAMILLILPINALAYRHSSTTPLREGSYKSWKQTDTRWSDVVIGYDPWTDSSGTRHSDETIGHAGCFITAIAILSRAYGLTLNDGTAITPGTLGKFLYDDGSMEYLSSGGAAKKETTFSSAISGLNYVNMISYHSAKDVSTLLSDTDHEYVLVAAVKNYGHYVAIDYVDDNTVYICDPGYTGRTTLSSYSSVNAIIIYEISEEYLDDYSPIESYPLWKVTESVGIKVRSGPGLSYSKVTSYSCGTTFNVLETQQADGYVWAKTEDGWCVLAMDDGAEIYCECISNGLEYPVYYHLNGGTDGPETQYKISGEDLTLSSVEPVKDGSIFLGWSADPSATSADYPSGGIYQTDEPVSLFAVWIDQNDIWGFGIDVSSHQGTVNWSAVAASGITFVILRAGTSKGVDTKFEENYRLAKENGLAVGCYFYSYSITEEDMKNDALLFLSVIEGKEFDFPVYLDVETSDQANLDPSVLMNLITIFTSTVRSKGFYTGVYSSSSWFYDSIDTEKIGGIPSAWIARWTDSGRLTQNMSDRCAVYQYSETGHINGISVTVDLDICYVDFGKIINHTSSTAVSDAEVLESSGLFVMDGFLYNAPLNKTVSEWQSFFSKEVTFYTPNGTTLQNGDTVFTGCTVSLGSQSYVCCIKGDLNGDQEIGPVDYLMLKRYVLGTLDLSPAASYSGCITDVMISNRDYLALKRYVLGTFDIFSE